MASSGFGYVGTPLLTTDPQDVFEESADYLRTNITDWEPRDGDLDTTLLEATARAGADIKTAATENLREGLRGFGPLADINAIEDAPAVVMSTWTTLDAQGPYTIPAGTQCKVGEIGFAVVTEVVVANGVTTTASGGVELEAVVPGTDGNGVSGTATLIDGLPFVSTITLVDSSIGGTDAETLAEYEDRLSETLRLMSFATLLPEDVSRLARTIAGVHRAVTIDLYNPQHNSLTLNQASLETDTTGWAALANCTIASSALHAADGTKSLELSSTAGGDMTATTPTGVSGEPVTAGENYTVRAQVKAGTSTRTVSIGTRFYDAGGTAVAAATFGTGVVDSAANFDTVVTQTVVAPATAAFASVIVKAAATGAASEEHYFDKIAFRQGTYTGWAAGGTAAEGVPLTFAVAAVDAAGAVVSGAVKTAIAAALTAVLLQNWQVFVFDAAITAVDVSFTVRALPGYTSADIEARTEAAIAAYLDPAWWGIPPGGDERAWTDERVVREYELVEVLNRVDGVNYVTAVTSARSGGALLTQDLMIPGPAALASAGVITATVTVP